MASCQEHAGDFRRPEHFAPQSRWFKNMVERDQLRRERAITAVEFIAEDYQKLAELGEGEEKHEHNNSIKKRRIIVE